MRAGKGLSMKSRRSCLPELVLLALAVAPAWSACDSQPSSSLPVSTTAFVRCVPAEEVVREWDGRDGPLQPGHAAIGLRVVYPDYGVDCRARITVSWDCAE